MWLWIGAIIAALGGLIALWPVPRRSGTGSRPPRLSVRRRRLTTLPATSPLREAEPERERELV